LQELPTSMGQLNAFQTLQLNYCLKLKQLLKSISQLNAL
jgi:hypothetical protein